MQVGGAGRAGDGGWGEGSAECCLGALEKRRSVTARGGIPYLRCQVPRVKHEHMFFSVFVSSQSLRRRFKRVRFE